MYIGSFFFLFYLHANNETFKTPKVPIFRKTIADLIEMRARIYRNLSGHPVYSRKSTWGDSRRKRFPRTRVRIQADKPHGSARHLSQLRKYIELESNPSPDCTRAGCTSRRFREPSPRATSGTTCRSARASDVRRMA